MENKFMYKLALRKMFVKPIVVSQIIYLEIYLVDLMNATIYIQIKLCTNENRSGKWCHIHAHRTIIVAFNMIFFFYQNILGNTWNTNFIVNWHYEKCLVLQISGNLFGDFMNATIYVYFSVDVKKVKCTGKCKCV